MTRHAALAIPLTNLIDDPTMKKLGLILSTAAVLFIAVCLPLHYHAEEAQTASKADCVVCHFSREARASNPTPSFISTSLLGEGILVQNRSSSPLIAAFEGIRSTRAPPVA